MNEIIGTCSECGGPVQIPDHWMGIRPPRPTCGHCGAVARESYGPVIPMEPRKPHVPDPLRQREVEEKFRKFIEDAEKKTPWRYSHAPNSLPTYSGFRNPIECEVWQ